MALEARIEKFFWIVRQLVVRLGYDSIQTHRVVIIVVQQSQFTG